MRLARLAPLLLLAACAHAQPGFERSGPVLDELKFEGVSALDEDELRGGLVTRASGILPWSATRRFDQLAFDVDLRRLEAFYRLRGYYRARVAGTQVAPSGKGHVEVTVTIDEGEPTRLSRLELRGLDGLPADVREAALDGLPLAEGKVLRVDDLDASRDRLRRRLLEAGYARARVEWKADVYPERSQAEVKLDVEPGPLFRFGAIQTMGLRIVSQEKVRAIARRALPVGERFSPEALEQAQALVYQLRVFKTVRLVIPEQVADPSQAPVRVVAQERAAHRIAMGAGVGVERALQQLQLSFDYENVDLLGGASRLSWENELALRMLPSLVRPERVGLGGTSQIELTFPELFRATDLALRGGAERELREAYSANLLSARLGLPIHLRANASLVPSVGPRAWTGISSVALSAPVGPEISPECPEPCRTISAALELTVDGRDDPVWPRHGYLVYGALEYLLPLASRIHALRLQPELRGWVPAGNHVVLAGRVRLGALFGLGEAVPVTVRLFDGGADGHRGFGSEQLAPLLESAQGSIVPVGGAGMWLTSAEVRWRFANAWGLVLFTDWGDVTVEPLRFDLTAAPLAVGVGGRWYSPAGPVRVDFAWRPGERTRRALNTAAPAERRAFDFFSFTLSLGEGF